MYYIFEFYKLSCLVLFILLLECQCLVTEQTGSACEIKQVQLLSNRRNFLISSTSFASLFSQSESAFAANLANSGPIAVLGASGRTGALCVLGCLARGLPVRALTRTGKWPPDGNTVKNDERNIKIENNPLLTISSCDINDLSAVKEGINGCRAVIYAASASKNGGNPEAIDNLGVVAAGEACLAAKIGRYVVLSSTAVTRPKSLGYIFTNLSVGFIMDEKRKGELQLMEVYNSKSKLLSSPSFTIVRPGGLEDPKKIKILGPAALEISQGDTLAGSISRVDVAEIAIELALSEAPNLRNTALELYYTDSAVACERRFKSNLSNGKAPRLHGKSYDEIFQGITPNIDYDNSV